MPEKVTLYVYDLSRGMARQMSLGLTGMHMDGIWHTSVVVFGREFYFGQGILNSSPGMTPHGNPLERIDMGETELPVEIFMEYIDNMHESYSAESYHLIEHNCNNFSNEVCNFLVGRSIPAHITSLPADFMNSPFGQSMAPMIQGMFGNGGSPMQAASAQPALLPQTPATATAVQVITDLSRLQNLIQNNAATVVYFTSATCPPCRVIAPVYEDMIAAKGNAIVGLKVDIGVSHAIGRHYEVRATPTFMFFLRGKLFSQFSGANQGELRTSIDVLLYSVKPAHPHALLSFSNYKALSTTPILFTSLDTVDQIFAKLETFISTEQPLTDSEQKQLKRIQSWLKSRRQAIAENKPEPGVAEMGSGWKPLVGQLLQQIPYDQQFPVLDIIRMLMLNSRVAEVYAKDGNQTLVSIFKKVAAAGSEGSKPMSLLSLRVACNGFGTTTLSNFFFSATARESVKQLLITMLLSPDDQRRQTAASLAFNISTKVAHARADDTVDSLGLDDDWVMECISALAAALEAETSEEIVHRLVASIANFVYCSPEGSGAVLLDVLGIQGTLATMMETSVVKAKNVVGLCKELQEMVKVAVEANIAK